MPPLRPISFNMLLSQEEKTMIQHAARLQGQSMSDWIRVAFRARFAMEAQGAPTCANGHGCFVPNMHTQTPAAPASPAPLTQP